LPDFSEVEAVALALAYAFSGGAVATASAGETRDAGRTVARSMYVNLAVVAVFYAFIQYSYEAINPAIDDPTRALSAAGAAVFGDIGVTIISLAAIISIATGQLNFFIAMPRILFGMGRRGSLPRIFGYLSDRSKTPSAAIGIYCAIIAGLAVSGTFAVLVSLLVAAEVVLSFALVCALYRLWQRNTGGIAERMGPVWIPVGLIATGFILWLGAQLPLSAFLGTGAMMAVGMVLYWLAKRAGHEGEAIHIIE
jgi:amino acid transporter